MFVASMQNRLTTFVDGKAVDVEEASHGRFGSDVAEIYRVWDDFTEWGRSYGAYGGGDVSAERLNAPSPRPSQVFAISLNYLDHAEEANLEIPDFPSVFTKFPSCIVGPDVEVQLAQTTTDWEVELVLVIGRAAHQVSPADGWDYVAGVTIGQDLSDRTRQLAGMPYPQFSLGKSYPGYGPTGPWLVTPDELEDRDDLALRCTVDDEVVQDFRSSKMIFTVPQLVAHLSTVVELRPGDLIFTGTSSGVGFARSPKRFLSPGQRIVSQIEGVGTLRTQLAAAATTPAAGA
ncbi:fumarylacetoacetate hydrolase family protein [Mycobacterium sp. 4858]|uniref:fumarylacetoacetate hydrolase family protein n=1 Tax=Mycobacterium sp. 4858 TaxID=2057185 RepID=UPI000C814897|nr:fumarylacetoacetate hydrolase family protein [Mycobacterium sp. 4858]